MKTAKGSIITTVPGNDFPTWFLNSGILILAVQKLCPQTGSPYILWLCASPEFPLGLFAGFRAYASLLCQCQRHEKLGASPEALIFNWNWKPVGNSKWKKIIRSASAAIKAEDYVNRGCDGLVSFPYASWSGSDLMPPISQYSKVLTVSISLTRIRRRSAPCRAAQPLSEKTLEKMGDTFPFIPDRKLAMHVPCRSHVESTGDSGAICHVVGSPLAVKAVRCNAVME